MTSRAIWAVLTALVLAAAGCSGSTDPARTDDGFRKTIDIVAVGLGGMAWVDNDGDGIRGMGDFGLAGVEVHLLDCAGTPLDTMVTDPAGQYGFGGLAPGDYAIGFVLPDGYAFSPQDQGQDPDADSDADPVTGLTACITLADEELDLTVDAGLVVLPVGETCTYGKGYWKNRTGCVRGEDRVSDLLPQHLGTPGGEMTLEVADACEAFGVLSGFPYCVDKDGRRPDMSNGIVKLYAHLLATKLNIAHGADDADVAATVADADAFLADHDWHAWDDLDQDTRHLILGWKDALEDYNEGRTGPGNCEGGDDDDDDDDDDHDDDDDDDDGDEDDDDDD